MYTKGPWEIGDYDYYTNSIAVVSDKLTICKVYGFPISGSDDARLIAAAPDLLEALQGQTSLAIKINAWQHVGRKIPQQDWLDLNDATMKAEAAITKATT